MTAKELTIGLNMRYSTEVKVTSAKGKFKRWDTVTHRSIITKLEDVAPNNILITTADGHVQNLHHDIIVTYIVGERA